MKLTTKRQAATFARTDWRLWAMAFPFIILVLLFHYAPLAGWSMAFVKYIPGLSIFESEFVGMDYFRQIFGIGSELPKAIANTLALGFLGILTAPLPMLLAILITEVGKLRMRKFFQVSLSLPNFISFIIVYSIFFTFFSVDGGFINQLLLKLGLIEEPTNLLGNESATWVFQTMVNVWKSMGWSAIIYIGAIASIDTQLYDAASVDGAGRFKKALHVTLPGLMPTFTVLLLLSIGNLLSSNFEQIYVFHNALNHDRIITLDYYSYQAGLVNFDFSLGTAIGMFKSVTSLIILFAANGIIKRISGNSII